VTQPAGEASAGHRGWSTAIRLAVARATAPCVENPADRLAFLGRAVLADFAVLLDWFAVDAPFDGHVIALEHLLAAVELIIDVKGSYPELDALRNRTMQVLARSLTD
jgi:hypothetical protein